MLGLKIAAPEDLVVELVVVLLEKLHSLGVGHVAEFTRHDVVEPVKKALVDKLVEERHFFRRILENIRDHELDHVLGHAHIVRQVRERHFGLDHPELGGVARGVGIFGAEGRAEGVDIAESLCEGLTVQLTGHGQIRLLAEEVFGIVDRAIFESGRVIEVERRHLEHFAGTFTVRACDERRVDIDEAALLEELVDGVGDDAAHAEDGLEGVRSRAQMRKCPQKLHGVALGLDREIGGRRALNRNFARLNFKRLLGIRRHDQRTGYDHSGADVQLRDLLKVCELRAEDNLHLRKIRAVGEVDEAEILAGAQIAHPAADLYGLAVKAFRVFE